MKDIKSNIFYPYRHSIRGFDYSLSTVGEMMFQRYMDQQREQGRKCDPRYVYAQMQEFLEYWKKRNRVY